MGQSILDNLSMKLSARTSDKTQRIKTHSKYIKYIKKSVRRLICILRCAKEFRVDFNYQSLDLQQLASQI